ncbi:sensor histidine kinase [Geodermatophilus sp. SYSU D00703]
MATRQQTAVPPPRTAAGPTSGWVALVDSTAVRHRPRAASVGRVVARFLAANVAAILLLLGLGVWASARAAEHEALADARRMTDLLAEVLVQPNLDERLLAGDPAAIAAFDARMRDRLPGVGIIRIKVWTADGQIVYSDEPLLIGRTFRLGADDRQALRDGVTRAEVSDLSRPENQFEEDENGRLLEVYRQITGPGGRPLLLETYSDYTQATSRQQEIWWEFAPISVAALLTMVAVQLPLARRMVTQLRATQRERELLQARALDASTEERRRIAGSLHDGLVQDVSAAALLVARTADDLRHPPSTAPSTAPSSDVPDRLGQAAGALRDSVASLRSLLVEIYPPNLEQSGLPLALADCTDRLRPRGIDVRLSLPDGLCPPPDVAALVLRTVSEALRNVVKHSGARSVDVTVAQDTDTLVLEITDDGVGFDVAPALDRQRGGHLGLRLLADLAAAEDATLRLRSAPGAGTSLRLEVPSR